MLFNCCGTRSKRDKDKMADLNIQQALTAALDNMTNLVAFPDDPLYAYEDARPYNLDIPIVPAAVTYPETAEQIAKVVACAAKAGLKVQARSGGHSYGNYSIGGVDGAIVVDMKNFQQFHMDTTTWNATIGAGMLLDDVTKKLFNAGGRAIAHGICPQVGAGGHLTIGGFGPMSRLWGTALDHILEVQVVLADSRIVKASATENPDVFFAIKGAASGFGIVTEFTVLTHPAPASGLRYSYTLELGSPKTLIQAFKNWLTFISQPNLSRNLSTQVTFCAAGMIVSGSFIGTQSEFDALGLDRIFPAQPRVNIVQLNHWLGMVTEWTQDVGLHLVGGVRCAFYSKTLTYRPTDLSPMDWVDSLLNYLDTANKGTLLWFVNFELQGGATNDVGMHDTAYSHRDALVYHESFGIDIGRVTETTRNFIIGVNNAIISKMPGNSGGAYPGYVDPEIPNGPEAYWGANLPRLEQIKRIIDPNDIFHNPQSVRPARN